MNKFFEKIFNLVSLMAVAMMTVPISLMFLGGTFPASDSILPAISILSTVVGYVLQAIIAKAAHKRASNDGFESISDGVLAGFSVKYAGIPIFLCLLISIVILFGYDAYMQQLCDSGVIGYHSIVYSFMMMAIFLISSIGGCVIWFYPLERLANIYVMIGGCAIYIIEFALILLTSRGDSTLTYLAVSFAVFLICMLIVFNQNNLQRKYRGSVVSVMTPSARMYNLFLVFMLVLMLVAVLAVSYITLAGLYLIGWILLYFVLFRFFYGVTAPESRSYEYASLDGEEAADMFRNTVMDQDDRILLSYFFAGLLVAAVIIIGLRTGILRKAINAIRAWIIDVFSTIFIGSSIMKVSFDPEAVEAIYNYKDEKKKLQNASIRSFEQMADDTDSYKVFMQRLGKLKTYDEQLCFAYLMLIKIYKKLNISIKLSDTPREVEKKVVRAVSSDEIERITKDFESIRYAETEKSDAEAAAILNNLCNSIKHYLF